LHKLIAEINTNYHRNTYYIEFNEKTDDAIKGWHQSCFEAYSKHWEAQTRKKGETIEIKDTPKKITKGTNDYEVFLDPIAKSRTNVEQTKKRKPTSKSVKKKELRKTLLQETDKNSKENLNQEDEQRKPKSKSMETQQTSSDKQVQKDNDHTSENSKNQLGLENRNNQESEQLELPEQVEVTNTTTAATTANLKAGTNVPALETGNHQEAEQAEETVQLEEQIPPAVATKAKRKVKRKTKNQKQPQSVEDSKSDTESDNSQEEKKIQDPLHCLRHPILPAHPSSVRKLPVPSSKSSKEKSPKKKSPMKNSPKKKSSPWKRKVKEWEEDESEEEEVEELSKGDKESSKEKDISDDEESLKEKEVSDDDVSVGKLRAITEAKKRRTIDEDLDADDNKVVPSDYEEDKFVDFVELKSPAKIIPLLEQELVLPRDEVRNRKKPTPYQQIQQRLNVHKTAKKEKERSSSDCQTQCAQE
jgi:hypothetical protein